jgi:hypothetical protein
MKNKFSIEWLFFILGIAYWVVSMNLQPITMVCVFYSLYVGFVWGAIPEISKTEPMSWRHILPPFVLVLLMMFSANLRILPSAEVVTVTAMALIHLRAAVLSISRLALSGFGFALLQLMGFILSVLYLFQKNVLTFELKKGVFQMLIVLIGSLGFGILIIMKRNMNAKRAIDDGSISSHS